MRGSTRHANAGVCFVPLALAACLQPASPAPISGDNGGCVENCHHASSASTGVRGSGGTAATSGGASSGAASSVASSSTSSTSGGTSGGTSSGSEAGSSGGSTGVAHAHICPQIAVAPLPMTCATGAAPLAAQIVDAIACTVVSGADVSAVGAEGVPIPGTSAVTDANGAFAICLPFATPFTVTVTASSYLNTYLAEISFPADGGAAPDITQVALIQEDFVTAFSTFVPGGYDSSKGLIIANVSGPGVCAVDAVGWSLALTQPDGGEVQDGGDALLYLGGSDVPDPSLTATSKDGTAVIVNIVPPLDGYVAVSTSKADAGACPINNPNIGLTGRIFVSGNSNSFLPFIMR